MALSSTLAEASLSRDLLFLSDEAPIAYPRASNHHAVRVFIPLRLPARDRYLAGTLARMGKSRRPITTSHHRNRELPGPFNSPLRRPLCATTVVACCFWFGPSFS